VILSDKMEDVTQHLLKICKYKMILNLPAAEAWEVVIAV